MRPTVRSIRNAIDELLRGSAPFRMHGEIWGALEANLALARTHDLAAQTAVTRFRGAILDRRIAVPLYFLEAFSRR